MIYKYTYIYAIFILATFSISLAGDKLDIIEKIENWIVVAWHEVLLLCVILTLVLKDPQLQDVVGCKIVISFV